MTFVASVNAIAYTGATPVFADIASLTEPWLALEAAEAAVTTRTRAIITVAYGGHPGATEALPWRAEETIRKSAPENVIRPQTSVRTACSSRDSAIRVSAT
jgi:hypothetical protein